MTSTPDPRQLAEQLREAVAGGNAERVAALGDDLAHAVLHPSTPDPSAATVDAGGQPIVAPAAFNALTVDESVRLMEADRGLYDRSLAHAAATPAPEGS